ncbi:hypothetical protein DH96_02055 [Candidatus Phytoplasma oryzae]|uniref:Uncharacterized protein n=1 Tax=Candidatus Phytoplasma oryzae TaxID=203274 RepID=A0A328IR36_9MOLU|nr:hypothetical protein [Candidatus Phytoplasma oryzae]RAM57706.1 hypothetical protein DH96_02055 [Candidatus Phytoplasma oryzae]
MNFLEVKFSINNNHFLCFVNKEIVYYPQPETTLIKEMIIIDSDNQIKHHWFFYRNQVLKSYQKKSILENIGN